MAARNYHLRASATATGSAAASVPILRAGTLKCFAFRLYNSTTAAACISLWELSLVPQFQSNTNDAPGIIGNAMVSSETGTLRTIHTADICNIRVNVGDRLYLHVVFVTGNETTIGIVNANVEEAGG